MVARISLLAMACVALVAAAPCDAAAQPGVVERCLSLRDDAQLLACYVETFGRSPSAAAPDATPEPVPTAMAGETANRDRDPEKWQATRVESITRKVSAAGRDAPGWLVVTLEDGQVWALAESKAKAVVRPGDTVTIKRAAPGSYMLLTPGKVATRVRRVR